MHLVRAYAVAALVLGTAGCGADGLTAAVPADVRPSPWVEMLRRPDSPVVQAADPRPGAVIRIRCGASFSPEHPPLLVVDGRLVLHDNMHALRINPEMIANAEIMKGPSAVKRYGPAAADGVVLITLKHDR